MMSQDYRLRSEVERTSSSSLSVSGKGLGDWGGARLPRGIDYAAFGMREVFTLLNWQATTGKEPQLCGACPIPRSQTHYSRNLSVHLQKVRISVLGLYKKGNQLDWFAAAARLPLYLAAAELLPLNCPAPEHYRQPTTIAWAMVSNGFLRHLAV